MSAALAGLTATMLTANTLLAPYAAALTAIREPVQQCAGEHGLDPVDVAAVVLLESGGDADAVNEYSGATGLMQVMPSDAWKWVPAEKEELRAKYKAWFGWRPTSDELKAPDVNLEWGCKILAGYVERAGGDMKRALYYYSGGDTWPSVAHYEETYWQRFEQFREALHQVLAV